MTSVVEAKAELRRAIVARVTALPPENRAAEEAGLFDRFVALPGLEGAKRVLLYAKAFPEEIETAPMLRHVLDRGATLVLPRVDRKERRLRLYEIDGLDRDLERGMLGIPEPRRACRECPPEAVDWVLAPGLGFDRSGYRIGRGAGHYDRLLPTLRPDAPRWGLLLTPQWVETLPVEPHDQRLDGVADYREVLAFERRPTLT